MCIRKCQATRCTLYIVHWNYGEIPSIDSWAHCRWHKLWSIERDYFDRSRQLPTFCQMKTIFLIRFSLYLLLWADPRMNMGRNANINLSQLFFLEKYRQFYCIHFRIGLKIELNCFSIVLFLHLLCSQFQYYICKNIEKLQVYPLIFYFYFYFIIR